MKKDNLRISLRVETPYGIGTISGLDTKFVMVVLKKPILISKNDKLNYNKDFLVKADGKKSNNALFRRKDVKLIKDQDTSVSN